MTDQNLSDLLESSAERTAVGPAPVAAMLANNRRRRTRRARIAVVAASVAVIAIVGGAAALSQTSGNTAGPSDGNTQAPSSAPPSAGTADANLNGTWTVAQLFDANGQQIRLPRVQTTDLRLTFHNGELSGNTVCNDLFGTYTQSGDNGQDVRFSEHALGSTTVGCQEPPLVERLLDVRHAAATGGGRVLSDEAGDTVIALEPVGASDQHGPGPGGASSLTPDEVASATTVAHQKQNEVTGTFIGATAFATTGTPFDKGGPCDQPQRYINVRLVWKADAHFVHAGVPGQSDGPRKDLLVTFDPTTQQVCETGAGYRDVGANSGETLLYGQWPGKK